MMTPADIAFRRYRTERSDEAFREVVAAFLPMVYSTALRIGGGDAAEAEDVSQMVFADLVRKAPALREEASVGAWLHRHTCFLMKSTIRTNVRRRTREQAAATLHSSAFELSGENRAAMERRLDRCLESLRETDRRALVLRYLEGRDLREVGAALGIGDDAAQKRVSRALERLRALLTDGRTAGLSVAALLGILTTPSPAIVPEEVAAATAGNALRLAAARKGTLTSSTHGHTARIAALVTLSFGLILGVWYAWPDKTVSNPGRQTGSSAIAGTFQSGPAQRRSGSSPNVVYESVDSVLARLRTLVREPETSANARAIAALIDAVPFAQLPALARAIDETGVSGILYRSFPALLRRWGNHDTAAAMDWFVRHASKDGVPFSPNRSWLFAMRSWAPQNPEPLLKWYAAAVTARKQREGSFHQISGELIWKLGHLVAAKAPQRIDEFLASFPDRPIYEGSKLSLHDDLKNHRSTASTHFAPLPPPAFQAAPHKTAAEASVPTPAAYPELRTAFELPSSDAAAVVSENLIEWSRTSGAEPLKWAFAHLTPESAATMLEEIVAVWAQRDPADLRAWYASRPPLDWRSAGSCLEESIIRALAADNPVEATDFLVNQVKMTSVQVGPGMWSNMDGFATDIPAGLRTADQCKQVLALLDQWPAGHEQSIELLEEATFARWKRWDPAAAEEWAAARRESQ
ncbi:MAG TPA: sigma-70 family RNA polymerase sigma factor [Verrucomicrobiales bacterium]|nr:sigma-70 family RNA polymerase sigma factor [Verrucomicrobiales bacterium]